MIKFAAWAVLAAAVSALAIFGLRKLESTESPVPSPAGGSPFPSAAPVAEGIQTWTCPAYPEKWFDGAAKAEVVETPERWQEYLRLSGFEPPRRVDLARSRVALVPFIGGGGVSLVDVAAVPAEGGLEILVKAKDLYGPDDPRPEDIRYDCRLVVVPREAGLVAFRTETERPAPRPSRRRGRR